jgi:hypothetical protein
MTLAELTKLANCSTFERRRAEAMGFIFSNIEVQDLGGGALVLRGDFTCVCGTPERFSFAIDEMHLLQAGTQALAHQLLNPAWHLQRYSSFSLRHLLGDGYSKEAAEEIVRKGRGYKE